MAKEETKHKISRRDFIKKAAYIAPTVITLQAAPMYARAGSVKPPRPPREPKPPKKRK